MTVVLGAAVHTEQQQQDTGNSPVMQNVTDNCVAVPTGVATSILMVTLIPESEFQPTTLAATHAAHNWCIRPLLEHSLLLRFTQGCKILLAAVIGQVVLLVVALLINNLDLDSGYPDRWL